MVANELMARSITQHGRTPNLHHHIAIPNNRKPWHQEFWASSYIAYIYTRYICPEHGVKLLLWVPTDGEVFPTDASPCFKALKCKLLLEEGFLPPLGSQVFEGFAWLLGPWLVSVFLIRLTAATHTCLWSV